MVVVRGYVFFVFVFYGFFVVVFVGIGWVVDVGELGVIVFVFYYFVYCVILSLVFEIFGEDCVWNELLFWFFGDNGVNFVYRIVVCIYYLIVRCGWNLDGV